MRSWRGFRREGITDCFTHRLAMADLQQLIATCAQMFSEGREVEDVLTYLRQNGCGKLDSMKALMKLKGTNAEDAKRAVYFSKNGADGAQRDEARQDALGRSRHVP